MAVPFLKRVLLLFALLFMVCVLLSSNVQPPTKKFHAAFSKLQEAVRIPISHSYVNKSRYPVSHSLDAEQQTRPDAGHFSNSLHNTLAVSKAPFPSALHELTSCPRPPNKFTGHVRLPNLLYNISMNSPSAGLEERRVFWNPTIIALPFWAKNQYLIVSMVTLQGVAYRRNILCEANICYPEPQKRGQVHPKVCSKEDIDALGPNGGLRCVTTPIEVDVPPTPAEKCEGLEQVFADIPGFHDPRIFYSGRGEPILMVVSQSRYACIGLWAIDLRVVYPAIEETFSSSPRLLGPGPLMSYPTLTEFTRNPPSTRHSYEKNWMVFSPSAGTSYIQYEMNSTSRTFAKLIGGGLTTTNLTDPLEQPCLLDATSEEILVGRFMENATWHQSTPSLRLTLCSRSNITCLNGSPDVVFFAAVQRKHLNAWNLPLRYERYFVIWSANSPFNMLAVSRYPLLFMNETNLGWGPEETWDDVPQALAEKRQLWGKFTYTTTIAYAWGRQEGDVREKATGYLDDEVIVSIGIDDEDGLYGKVRVSELLQCLRACPGRGRVDFSEPDQAKRGNVY